MAKHQVPNGLSAMANQYSSFIFFLFLFGQVQGFMESFGQRHMIQSVSSTTMMLSDLGTSMGNVPELASNFIQGIGVSSNVGVLSETMTSLKITSFPLGTADALQIVSKYTSETLKGASDSLATQVSGTLESVETSLSGAVEMARSLASKSPDEIAADAKQVLEHQVLPGLKSSLPETNQWVYNPEPVDPVAAISKYTIESLEGAKASVETSFSDAVENSKLLPSKVLSYSQAEIMKASENAADTLSKIKNIKVEFPERQPVQWAFAKIPKIEIPEPEVSLSDLKLPSLSLPRIDVSDLSIPEVNKESASQALDTIKKYTSEKLDLLKESSNTGYFSKVGQEGKQMIEDMYEKSSSFSLSPQTFDGFTETISKNLAEGIGAEILKELSSPKLQVPINIPDLKETIKASQMDQLASISAQMESFSKSALETAKQAGQEASIIASKVYSSVEVSSVNAAEYAKQPLSLDQALGKAKMAFEDQVLPGLQGTFKLPETAQWQYSSEPVDPVQAVAKYTTDTLPMKASDILQSLGSSAVKATQTLTSKISSTALARIELPEIKIPQNDWGLNEIFNTLTETISDKLDKGRGPEMLKELSSQQVAFNIPDLKETISTFQMNQLAYISDQMESFAKNALGTAKQVGQEASIIASKVYRTLEVSSVNAAEYTKQPLSLDQTLDKVKMVFEGELLPGLQGAFKLPETAQWQYSSEPVDPVQAVAKYTTETLPTKASGILQSFASSALKTTESLTSKMPSVALTQIELPEISIPQSNWRGNEEALANVVEGGKRYLQSKFEYLMETVSLSSDSSSGPKLQETFSKASEKAGSSPLAFQAAITGSFDQFIGSAKGYWMNGRGAEMISEITNPNLASNMLSSFSNKINNQVIPAVSDAGKQLFSRLPDTAAFTNDIKVAFTSPKELSFEGPKQAFASAASILQKGVSKLGSDASFVASGIVEGLVALGPEAAKASDSIKTVAGTTASQLNQLKLEDFIIVQDLSTEPWEYTPTTVEEVKEKAIQLVKDSIPKPNTAEALTAVEQVLTNTKALSIASLDKLFNTVDQLPVQNPFASKSRRLLFAFLKSKGRMITL